MQLYYLCLVVLYLCLYDICQSEYISMVRLVSTREVALYFGFEGAVVRGLRIASANLDGPVIAYVYN